MSIRRRQIASRLEREIVRDLGKPSEIALRVRVADSRMGRYLRRRVRALQRNRASVGLTPKESPC